MWAFGVGEVCSSVTCRMCHGYTLRSITEVHVSMLQHHVSHSRKTFGTENHEVLVRSEKENRLREACGVFGAEIVPVKVIQRS